MNINIEKPIIRGILNHIQKYNHKRYWNMRSKVVSKNGKSKLSFLLKSYYLLKIKKTDSYHNASMGTDLGAGAYFEEPPNLPHGLNGIIIGHNAKIGRNVTIYQQVTVMQGADGKGTIIGNNVLLGAGAKVLGGVKIGNNVRIGANAVVTHDIPDNAVAAGVPAIIVKINS